MRYHPSVYWFFLGISILLELIGLAVVKHTQITAPNLGVACMVALMCLSYYSLSKAILYLPLGVAYAIWEGVGLALVVIISVLIFDEAMSLRKALGLGLVFVGSILIHRGTDQSPEQAAASHARAMSVAATCTARGAK